MSFTIARLAVGAMFGLSLFSGGCGPGDKPAIDVADVGGSGAATAAVAATGEALTVAGCTTRTSDSSEYLFCTTERTWAAAQSSCPGAGLELVAIDNLAEDDFVRLRMSEESWIGANDIAAEGQWVWSSGNTAFWNGKANGSLVPGRYANWASQQPDDYSAAQDCASKRYGSDARWSDRTCTASLGYVCERPIDRCPDDPNKLAAGICGCGIADVDLDGDGSADCGDCTTAQLSGRKYLFCKEGISWSAARNHCRVNGMDLARIDSATENDFLKNRIEAESWIGATDCQLEGRWVWSSNGARFWNGTSTGGSVGGLFTNWASNQPDDFNTTQECASKRINSEYRWDDRTCSTLLHYVCEQDTDTLGLSFNDPTCNGIDDDCDGVVDDDYVSQPLSCGIGACYRNAQSRCANGVVDQTCTPGVAASSDALCNGVDDDCNGSVDEDYVQAVTQCGVGACAATGQARCQQGVVVDSCIAGAPDGDDADCDGRDDDCDARTDEGYAAQPIECGVGACNDVGTRSCVDGTVTDSCTVGAAADQDQVCNGIDDDCDGNTDEDFVPSTTTCGNEGCIGEGTTRCADGQLLDSCQQPCEGACHDQLDGDGDGPVDCADSDCDNRPDCAGVGTPCQTDDDCSALGALAYCVTELAGGYCSLACDADPSACPAGSFCEGELCLLGCNPDSSCDQPGHACQAAPPSTASFCHPLCPETGCLEGFICHEVSGDCAACTDTDADCDGLDSDCDGTIDDDAATVDRSCDAIDDDCSGQADEDYVPIVTECGVGVCAAIGATACVDGVAIDSCTPAAPQEDDSCDGVDQDCDGRFDETYVSSATTCGVGACHADGDALCSDGQVIDDCTPLTPAAEDADCDGVDDNCDGAPDDDYAPVATTCGIGACVQSGSTHCVAGTVLDTCLADLPGDEDTSCEGVDDDCDGEVDEGCERDCADGDDNDGDGHTDCRDSDCADAPECGIGRSCSLDDDCASLGVGARCLRELPQGYCTRACDFADVAGVCPEGSFCLDGENLCLLACDAGDSCADPTHRCAPLGTLDAPAFCRPTCALGCPADHYCEESTDSCQECELSDTTCDGVDDDCDGAADDDYLGPVTTCGTGACARVGGSVCIDAEVEDTCAPGAAEANDPSCDGIDQDCNGGVDEDFVPGCVGNAHTHCEAGSVGTTECADGDSCDGAEICVAGQCQAGAAPVLDDANACTLDSCDPTDGALHTPVPVGTSCSGGRVCNGVRCEFPSSCAEWLRLSPGAADGVYRIDVDGAGNEAPFDVYCDMSTDGGGWQLVTVTQPGRLLVGTGYCLSPSATTPCAGQLHRLQPSVRSQLLVRDLQSGQWLRYGGFAGGSASALRYLTRELNLTTSTSCTSPHVCDNTTRDPSLTAQKTSGFALEFVLPLKQTWRSGGFSVGGDPGAGTDVGRIHASTLGAVTDLRSRTALSANSALVSSGSQALFHRADTCSDGTRNGNETGVDCGGSCPGCASALECSKHGDCESGYCDSGSCALPERSCAAILAAHPDAVDGPYLIDVDGDALESAFRVYCDMSTDGGGWQLISSVRSDSTQAQLIVSSAYCTDPSPSANCKGHMHPLQATADTELMVQVPQTAEYLVYAGYSGGTQSALRYLTRELNLTTSTGCTAPHVCSDTTRDPGLRVARTSGFPLQVNAPLLQSWSTGGFSVGANPEAGTNFGRIQATSRGATDLRTREYADGPTALKASGHQRLLFRSGPPAASAQCTWRGAATSSGSRCSDGNACTFGDHCDGSGRCEPGTPLPAGTACGSGECTTGDLCDSEGACQPGTAIDVNDGDPCTQDSCALGSGIVHTPVSAGTSCSDGDLCNGEERCLTDAVAPRFIQVGASDTFLYHINDTGLPARAHRLADLGITPGQRLKLRAQGSFVDLNPSTSNPGVALVGVFSATDTLLACCPTNRVPGALAANGPTYSASSMSQDFYIRHDALTLVTVPAGANFLFLGAHDFEQFGNNSDLDGNFGLSLERDAPAVLGCRPGQPLSTDDQNACTSDRCEPGVGAVHDPEPDGASSCAGLGFECGQHDDGCGTPLDCGSCAAGQACGSLEPGRCGPMPLPVPAAIHVGREVNVAAYELGARAIEPASVHAPLTASGSYSFPSGSAPKTFTFSLSGGGPHVLDRIAFGIENGGAAFDHVEVWASDEAPFDPGKLVRVAEADFNEQAKLSFAPTRAQFVRLVLSRRYSAGNASGRIFAITAFTRAREGGVVSLLEGGSRVLKSSYEHVLNGSFYPATSAFDFSAYDEWWTTNSTPQWAIVELKPAGYPVSQLDLASLAPATDRGLRDFQLELSNTGIADSDFLPVVSGTMPANSTRYTFEFAPTPARFARIRLLNGHGPSHTAVANIRLFSPELGGAVVPFDDRTALPGHQIATRLWDFGDGETSTEAHPLHRYAAPGVYGVTLRVTDLQGRVGVASTSYTVLPTPHADFDWNPKPVREGTTYTVFTDQSQPPPGHVLLQRTWKAPSATLNNCLNSTCSQKAGINIPDISVSSQPIFWPQHGARSVELTVLDSQLVTGTLLDPITVENVAPTAQAGPDVAGIWGENAVLGAGGTVGDVSPVDHASLRCEWDFGDGHTSIVTACNSTNMRQNHVYADPGSYTARLTVFDDASSTTDLVSVPIDRRRTVLVPLMMRPTAQDGEFELSAQLFDLLAQQAPLAGFEVEFIHGDEIVTATTGSDSIARAIVRFAPRSYTTVRYAFAGDGRYHGSEDSVDFLVREGDTEPVAANPPVNAHEGSHFVVAFPQNANYAAYPPQNRRLIVSLSSRVNTTATIRAPFASFERVVVIQPDEVTRVTLPESLRMGNGIGDLQAGQSVIENKGIEITSLDEIAVHALDYIQSTSDAYLALPVSRLGNEYLALGLYNEKWTRFYTAPTGSQIAIAAVEDDTVVTVVPNADLAVGPALPQGARRGEAITFTLNALQTLQLHAASVAPELFEDVSGTRVISSKKVATYAGHVCSPLGGLGACDHVIEQMPPLSSLGTHFIVVPLASYNDSRGWDGDVIRILAAYDGTEVRVEGQLLATLNRGEVHQLRTGSIGFHQIATSRPALVGQYARGADGSSERGDPSLMLVPPVDQYISRFVISPPVPSLLPSGDTNALTHYFNLVAKSTEVGRIRINGLPVPSTWRPVGDGTYAGARIEVTAKTHVLEGLGGAKFMVLSYGRGYFSSYALAAGMELSQAPCVPTRMTPGDGRDNDCDGIESEELDNDIDDDGDGVPDEDLRLLPVPNAPNRAPSLPGGSHFHAAGPMSVVLAGYDADGDPLTYRIVSMPASSQGATTLNGPVLTFNGGFGTPRSFVVVANDGQVDSPHATITMQNGNYGCNDPLHSTVNICNNGPFFFGGNFDSQVIKVSSGQVLNFVARVFAHDWDRHAVHYQLVGAPAGMNLESSTGLVNWLVDPLMAGAYTFTVRAIDVFGATDSKQVTLTVITDPNNAPPVWDSQPVLQAEPQALYVYDLVAHDPENKALSYRLLAGPQGLQRTGQRLSWTPTDTDIGQHSVLLRVTDPEGGASVQSYVLTVAGSALQFVSAPPLLAAVGAEYLYQAEVARGSGDAQVTFDFEIRQCIGVGCTPEATVKPPAGMQLQQESGVVRWTPTAQQIGVHSVQLSAFDELGNKGKQFFSIEVIQASAVPNITSSPFTEAVVGGQYRYDVDAADLGEREILTYSLLTAPAGMNIDPVTGVITWQPDALGSHAVLVKVTDSSGQTDTQSFIVSVMPDSQAPVLEVVSSSETAAPGGSIVVTVRSEDDVAVSSVEVTVDGIPVTLDGAGQYVFSSDVPGVHTVGVTVRDGSGNVTTHTLLVGVQDAADTQSPVVELQSPSEDTELTYIHDVIGTASDTNLLGYTLALRRLGADPAYREVGRGHTSVAAGTLGSLDTTLLENGYYELRITARDVNGQTKELTRPFRVEGQAKVGLVQMSFVDMAMPMAGVPLSVVRSYDSRFKSRGDFGYGWRLALQQGSAQHNRPVGTGIAIYSSAGEFAFPCQGVHEQQSHYTEVRVSERERYIFRPVVANTEAIGGSCQGEIFFELVEGSTAGAELFVLGGEGETLVRSPALPIVHNPEVLPPSNLVYALDPDRGLFNPQQLRLELRDGRKFNLRVGSGIVGVEDRDGHLFTVTATGIHHSGGRSIAFERDSQGRITKLTDPQGRTVRYGYDLSGDLVRVTNPIAEITRFVYDQAHPHHLQDIFAPDGRKLAAMDYDPAGRLNEVCDAEGNCSESEYDLQARTVQQIDATQRPVSYQYDPRGNVTLQRDALGHAVHFTYDTDDNLLRAEGPDGSVATYTYNGSGDMLSRVLPHEADEDPADFTYRYTYTDRGDRDSVTLPSGGVIAFEYDSEGHLTATKDGDDNLIQSATYRADGTLSSKTDRFGTVLYDNYHATGQPTRVTDPFGAVVALQYDSSGRLLSRTERGVTASMSYDALGRPEATDYGNGARVSYQYALGKPEWTTIEGPTFGRVQRSFTATGRLGSWIEPNGDTFTRLYDAGGRVSEGVDALGTRTTYGYDVAGRLEAITDVALNATTRFERDAAGRVTRTTDAIGQETTTSYKLGGRLESSTNARGKTTSFDRTPTSASITDALNRTTATSLTPYGLPGSTTYPGGAGTSSSYLGTTRLDGSQQFPTGFEDELERSRDYGYDTKSGLASATDLAGENWSYQYTPAAGGAISCDVFSGSVSTANADGGASAYQSGGGGTEYRDVSATGGGDGGNFTHLLSQVTSPKGEVTKFERGTNGRINKVTYPDNGTRTITYGTDQRPQTITLPQGTVVTLDHDAFGREISRTTNKGEHRELTYGVGDRIETMEDNTGVTTYSYDSAGRFSGITYPSGASVMYTRDKLDRTTDVRVKATATAAEIITHYTYDPNGNLAEIRDPNGGVTGFTYDDADRLQQRVLPNGVVTSYGHDQRDRLLSVVHRNASNSVLASVVYERSASGEPTKITREDGTHTKVEYDSALRVKKEQQFDANNLLLSETSYDYDLDGNRTSKTALTGNETYSYAGGFNLAGISGADGNEMYAHDAGGRLTSVNRGGVNRTIEYDSMDHITRVVDGGIEVERYTFDGMGRRVAVNNGIATKRFLVAPNMGDGYESPQAVTDGSGNVIATFVYAGEHPIATITPSGAEYFLGDAMGSVVGKANAGGASTASIKYTAFGEVASAVGASAGVDSAVGAEPRFHGMTFDAGTGLYFVRARTYDARTGRFASRDPVAGVTRRPETMNPYVFASGNPQVWRDPSGAFSLMEVSVTALAANVLASTALPSLAGFLQRTMAWRAGWDAGAVSQLAGSTDTLSFGIGKATRDLGQSLGWWGDNVDEDSISYDVGVATGLILSLFQGGAAGAATAFRAAPSIGGAGTTVIGKTGVYVELAESIGANYLKTLPKKVVEKLGDDQLWYMNQVFLDDAIARGDEFIIAGGAATAKAGTWLKSEIDYLLYRGYRLSQDGTKLLIH